MIEIPEKINRIIEVLEQNGYKAYIVGGCVRDSLLGLYPSDFDITTSAKPEEIISLFRRTIPTGLKHGTVTVMVGKTAVEVTTFRTESGYTDSRHPENVTFVTSLKDDLSRRDFTVNALCFNKKSGVLDYFSGLSDLENKILRAVGDPEKRFSEDALRILRLFRFSSQLGFKPEENTNIAALKLKKGLQNISRERIFTELKKTLKGKNPNAISPLICENGLAFLGISSLPDFETVKTVKNEDLKLFAFLYGSSKDPIATLKALKASNRQIHFTENILKIIDMPVNNKPELKNAMRFTNFESVEMLLKFLKAKRENTRQRENLLEEIKKNNEPYSIPQLAISGKDLMDLGVFGADIKEALNRLLDIVIESPEKNQKEILLSLTK